jgi:hypothetical protein
MKLCPSGRKEILQNVGGDFLSYEKITVLFSNTDISHGFPSDSSAHQRSQEIPVTEGISLIEFRPKADAGRVFFVKGVFLQVFGKVNKHFPLCLPITTEGIKSFRFSEKKPCHFQFPGGQKTSVGWDILADAWVYFIPQLCQKQSVFRIAGDFFDIVAVHSITEGIIAHLLRSEKKFFLSKVCFCDIMPNIMVKYAK